MEKLSAALTSDPPDLHLLASFRLPPKLGGVLFGVYSKQDSRKYLELAVMGKISKGGGSCGSGLFLPGPAEPPGSFSRFWLILETLTGISSLVVLAAVRVSTRAFS